MFKRILVLGLMASTLAVGQQTTTSEKEVFTSTGIIATSVVLNTNSTSYQDLPVDNLDVIDSPSNAGMYHMWRPDKEGNWNLTYVFCPESKEDGWECFDFPDGKTDPNIRTIISRSTVDFTIDKNIMVRFNISLPSQEYKNTDGRTISYACNSDGRIVMLSKDLRVCINDVYAWKQVPAPKDAK